MESENLNQLNQSKDKPTTNNKPANQLQTIPDNRQMDYIFFLSCSALLYISISPCLSLCLCKCIGA